MAARAAILHRAVYGALRPVPTPLFLVASAASPPSRRSCNKPFAAARTQGKPLVVRDLVPLPRSDPRGATAFSMILSLIITEDHGLLGHLPARPAPAAAYAPCGHSALGTEAARERRADEPDRGTPLTAEQVSTHR
jgi:hypothetical protein